MRYNAIASFEENTVDPNKDGNLMVDGKNTENPGVEDPEDFDLDVSPDTKSESYDPDEHLDVREAQASVDNDFKESGEVIEAIDNLESISNEMRNVIAEHGKLTEAEMRIAAETVRRLSGQEPKFSFENIELNGMQYVGTEASMEGIISGISKLVANVGMLCERIIRATLAQIKAITPAIDKELTRANTIKSAINSANREEGMKTVTGAFLNKLVVDGQAPQAKTVIETANYLNAVLAETLSPKLVDQLSTDVKALGSSIATILNTDWDKASKPSGYLTLALLLGCTAVAGLIGLVGGTALKALHDNRKAYTTLKLDPNTLLPLSKLCPQTTKVRVTSDDANVLLCRSLPLFGNHVINTIELNPIQQVDDKHVLKLSAPGIYLFKNDKGDTSGNSMQALTEAEQRQVIDSAISTLSGVRQYYKAYPAKAAAYSAALKQFYKSGEEVQRVARGGGRSYAGFIYRGVVYQYGRSYLKSVLGNQNDIAKYALKTASALVTLVSKSANAAQAETGGVSDPFAEF